MELFETCNNVLMITCAFNNMALETSNMKETKVNL